MRMVSQAKKPKPEEAVLEVTGPCAWLGAAQWLLSRGNADWVTAHQNAATPEEVARELTVSLEAC